MGSGVKIGHRKALLEFAQRLEVSGLVVGTAGNISIRSGSSALITPTNLDYSLMTTDDLVEVGMDGRVACLAGGGYLNKPSSEIELHLAILRAFPEVGAVVHCHSVYASMFAVAHRGLPPVIEESVIFLGGPIEVIGYEMTGTSQLAAAVVEPLARASGVLLANHGAVAIGANLSEAFDTALMLERDAQIVLGAQSLGGVEPIPETALEALRSRYLERRRGWIPG